MLLFHHQEEREVTFGTQAGIKCITMSSNMVGGTRRDEIGGFSWTITFKVIVIAAGSGVVLTGPHIPVLEA